MVWGADSAADAGDAVTGGATHLLGFNEPERGEQANMDVDQAITLWPQLEATGLRLGSPATASSPDGEEWLEQFMTQAQNQGRRVDFIAVHWYGWGSSGCDNINAHFTGYMDRMMSYGVPVWITEWGCYDETEADARAFYDAAVEWLIDHPQVERYAWFLTRASDEHGAAWDAQDLVGSDGALTALGQDYAASLSRR